MKRVLIGRRSFVGGSGTLAATATLQSLFGPMRPARATEVAVAVPEVDDLAVRVVTDSYQIAVAPSTKAGDVAIEHFGWGIGDAPPGPTLASEFGLSLHAESRVGDQSRQVLIDFGFTSAALTNNLELLGLDPSRFDALILSHGHYDHFGGLSGFLKRHQAELKPGTPFVYGGEECFCARRWTGPPHPGDFGAIDRESLRAARLAVTAAEAPMIVADHAFTTGQTSLASFEKVLSPSALTVGIKGGFGCYAEKMPVDERGDAPIPDTFRHELATIYNLKGRGLVVLTSCSHRGVVNIVKRAQDVSGVKKVYAVMAGFHLAPFKEEYLHEVVDALKEIDPDYIVSMHCTGEAFWDMARREMPGKMLRAYTGTRFVFRA